MSKYKVITDPCYILPKETWDACLRECDQYENDNNWSDHFNEAVTRALTEFSGSQAYVESTGFGDWDNDVYGPAVVQSQFAADSGMVCVCDYSDPVKGALHNTPEWCVAMIETEGNINVKFDTSVSDWTVVYISDSEGNEWHTHIPDDEEDEE